MFISTTYYSVFHSEPPFPPANFSSTLMPFSFFLGLTEFNWRYMYERGGRLLKHGQLISGNTAGKNDSSSPANSLLERAVASRAPFLVECLLPHLGQIYTGAVSSWMQEPCPAQVAAFHSPCHPLAHGSFLPPLP